MRLLTSHQKLRNSNLELYRIIVMLLIVAHHYIVNSGLIEKISQSPFDANTVSMALLGSWGKTGINCFVLITGYFMCKSRFTLKKLIKLYLQITFYSLIIYGIFCISGHETFTPLKAIGTLFPINGIDKGFTSCFLVFIYSSLFLIFLSNILPDEVIHT